MFKIFHAIVVNKDTREAGMDFLTACVQRNVKRSQLQVNSMDKYFLLNCG